jgi:hypothetical protein
MQEIISLTYDEIYTKIFLGTYTLVHMKETMQPKLYDNDNEALLDVPDGYLEYDKERYYRKF